MRSTASVQLATYDADVSQKDPKLLESLFTPLAQHIARLQCDSKNVNPLVAVVTGAVSLAVQVTTTETGTAQLNISWPPSGSLGGSYAKAQQEGITVPITFVSASNLPDFYLGQVLPYFANLGGLPPAPAPGAKLSEGQVIVQGLIVHELETRERIHQVVARRIAEYPSLDCKQVEHVKAGLVFPAQ
jgi:hypothetical protein